MRTIFPVLCALVLLVGCTKQAPTTNDHCLAPFRISPDGTVTRTKGDTIRLTARLTAQCSRALQRAEWRTSDSTVAKLVSATDSSAAVALETVGTAIISARIRSDSLLSDGVLVRAVE